MLSWATAEPEKVSHPIRIKEHRREPWPVSGLSEEEITKQLSQVLPGVVDKLTPNGRLPTITELSQQM